MHTEDARPLEGEGEEYMAMYQGFRLGTGLTTAVNAYPAVRLAGMLQLAETSCASLGLDPDFHGRIVHAKRADIQLARKWLDECISKHRSFCHERSSGSDVDTNRRPNPEDLRVIDVGRMNNVGLMCMSSTGEVGCHSGAEPEI